MAIRYLSGINVDSNTLFVDDANNRVGIGTASPTSLIHGKGTSSSDVTYRFEPINNSYKSTLYISSVNSGDGGFRYDSNLNQMSQFSYGDMIFYVGTANISGTIGDERLRIRQDGNVGIGTTSPQYKLDVNGSGRYYNSTNGNFVSLTLSNTSNGSSARNTLQFTNDAGNVGSIDVFGSAWSPTGGGDDVADGFRLLAPSSGGLSLRASTSTIRFYTGSSERMRITSAGNVGIGTNAPQLVGAAWTTLEVQGQSAGGGGIVYTANNGASIKSHFYSDGNGGYIGTQTNNYFAFTSNNIERMRISSAGDVAIGMSDPAGWKLRIDSATGANLYLYNSVTTGNRIFFADQGWSADISHSAGNLLFKIAGATEAMRINTSGNVGIGTTSPSSRLSVVNSASPYQLSLKSDTTKVWSMGVGIAGYYQDWFLLNDGSADIFRINGGYTQITNALYVASNFRIDTNGDAYQPTTGGVALWAATANATYPSYGFYGDTGIGMYRAAADTLAFSTGGTERMRITSAGNVGIGTTVAVSRLHVLLNGNTSGGPTGNLASFQNSSSGSNAYITLFGAYDAESGIVFTDESEQFKGKLGYNNVSEYMYFQTDGSERMRIASTGATRLNAYGSGSFTGTVAYNLAVDSSGNIIETAGGVVDGSGTANYVTKWIDGNTVGNSLIYDDGTTITFQTGASERMRITSDGNVAINSTTTSGYRLYVNGSTWINGGTNFQDGVSIFRTESGAAEVMRIASNGNVGIGTTTPANRLQIGSVGSSGFGGNDIVIGNGTQVMAFYQSSTVSTWYTNTNFALMPSGVGATGNVGIGTTSPGAKLHVSGGEIRVDAGQSITLDASNVMYLVGASNQLRLYNGANPVVNITTAGNVGIGTTSPGSLLHVYGATPTVKIQGTGTASAKIDLVGPYTVWTLENQYINGATNDMFRISNSELGADAITINRLNNNVGIGTTAPSYKLDITANNNASIAIAESSDDPFIWFDRSDGGSQRLAWRLRESAVRSLIFETGSSASKYGQTFTEAMRITSAGNVGIGTTSPSYKLDVAGDIRTSGVGGLYIDASANFGDNSGASFDILNLGSTRALRILATTGGGWGNILLNPYGGNVGIGTTSPARLLHIKAGSGATGAIRVDSDNGNVANVLEVTTAGDWSFNTNAQEVMRLYDASGGRVGIGTTSPTEKLHVVGNIKVEQTSNVNAVLTLNPNSGVLGTGYQWNLVGVNSAASYAFQIREASSTYLTITNSAGGTGGNVGIGTTTPTQKLQVNGVIEAGPLSVAGGPMIYQSYSSPNYIGSIGSEYSSGAMLIGYGATGKNGASGYVSTFDNFSGVRGLIRLVGGRFSILSTISAVSTATGGDLTMTTNFVVTDDGNVGIGTTSPAYKLDVAGTTNTAGLYSRGANIGFESQIAALGTNGSYQAGYYLGATNTSYAARIGMDVNSGDVYIGIGTTSGLTNTTYFKANGNLGLGLDAPTQKLHVSGNVRVTGAYYDSNNSAGSSGQVLSSTGSGTDWVSLSEITGVDGTGTANYIAKWSDTDTITNSSITDNGSTVTANVDRLNMNKQAGIYTFSKTLGATVASDFFSISNSHGAQAFRVTFVCSSSGYSVAKTYEVVHAYGQTPIYFKVVDTGPYGSEDFDVAFTDSNSSTGVKATVTNNSATTAANIVATVFLGGGFETITVTAL